MSSIIVKESSMIRYRYKTPYDNREIIEPAFWLANKIKYSSDSEKDSIIYRNSSHKSNIVGIREYRGKDVQYIEGIRVNGQFNTYFQSSIVRHIIDNANYDASLNGYWYSSPISIGDKDISDYELQPEAKRDYYLLAGIISPLITKMRLNADKQVESICLTAMNSISSRLIGKLQQLFKNIYDSEMILYAGVTISSTSKNSYFDEILIRHDNLNVEIGRHTLLSRVVQFLRYLFCTPLITYKCAHIPSGVITATKESQDAYIQGMGLVYTLSTKFKTFARCGIIKSPIRSMETSLRYLMEMRNEPYKIKYYDSDYRCTFTATPDFNKMVRNIMEHKPTDDSVFIELCKIEDMNPSEPCIEIFYDSDYIEVDGLVIPS